MAIQITAAVSLIPISIGAAVSVRSEHRHFAAIANAVFNGTGKTVRGSDQ